MTTATAPARIWPQLAGSSPLKQEIVDKGIDFIIVRELIGGIYFGRHETLTEGGEAVLFNCLTIQRDFPQTRIVLLTPLQSVHAGLRPITLAGDCIEACARQLDIECFRQDKECCVKNLTEQKTVCLPAISYS